MRATVILVHPLHAFAPLADKEVNESTSLEAIHIIRTYIVVVCIFTILILLHSDYKISIERFQNMLIRAG